MRLAALIANHGSGAHALACARSLRVEWARLGRAARDLDLVVCDDASPGGEEGWLARLAREGAHVVRRAERGGYAAAIGTALDATSGGPNDVVAVLNADLVFLPDSLGPCLRALADDAGLGAVAPRTVADPAAALELPPQELPQFGNTEIDADARAQRALAVWSARGLVEREMLSGACLFLRREWIARAGGLLDARYPLYFEDTDLCRRLTAAGARLGMCREATVVHFWARSTGIGADFEARAAERFRAARARYVARWHGGDALRELERAQPVAPTPAHDFAPLGALDAPPELTWTRDAFVLVEVGMGPDLALAAGALVDGARWRLPAASWEWLHAARYFVRVLERDTLACLGAWTFDKPAPPRRDPEALVAGWSEADAA